MKLNSGSRARRNGATGPPRVVVLAGVRTPFCKAGGRLRGVEADDLGALAVTALLSRTGVRPEAIDEVIFGNVAQPTHAANIARVIALKAGLPSNIVAHSVHHNCASGMQSLSTAAMHIQAGQADLVLAGGTESMSQIPLLFGDQMTALFGRLMRSRTMTERLRAAASFRLSHLKPVVALQQGLTDPICELNVGQTAEVLAREFGVTRHDQDEFALQSHLKATAARARLDEEVAPIVPPPDYVTAAVTDDGPRPQQSLEALERLRPYFDKEAGTVTAGNACPVTDGAVALFLCSERKAQELNIEPIGYLDAWAYGALEGRRMGLGPVVASSRLFDQTGYSIDDFDLIEINEAFAAQVLACLRAFASSSFAAESLNRNDALGEIDPDRLNVNGGAIALGHPVGATGSRLVLTMLHELRRRNCQRGLATLCVGGGQGAAFALEAA